jgi:prolyl oligopeptidase
LTLAIALLAAGSAPTPPPAPVVESASDTYFGVNVPDPYRYFEKKNDPRLATYFRQQNTYTRALLDALPGRAALAARIAALDNVTESLGYVQPHGSTYFYEKRPPGANTTALYTRAIAGGPERLLLNPDRFATGPNQHFSIDYYSVSNDGTYLAVGVSEGGSEVTTLHLVDVRSGRVLADTIPHAIYVAPNWRDDGRSFFYFQPPTLAANAPESEKDTKGVTRLHVIGRDPARDPAVFGYGVSAKIHFAPEDGGFVNTLPHERWAIGIIAHGVQNEVAVYAAPLATITSARVPWREIADFSDDITDFAWRGDTLYLDSHAGAPRHRIIAVDLRRPSLAHARVVVPESTRVIEGVSVAADGIYVRDLDGGLSKLRRIALDAAGNSGAITEIALPFTGAIAEVDTDPVRPGAVFGLQGWTQSPRFYHIDAAAHVADTRLRPPSPIDFSGVTSREVFAPSADGTQVPLSIVMRTDTKLDGSHPTLVDGYGAYGVVIRPSFSATRLALFERGGIYAECHPRGGGEFGEAWHLGAHIATKQRTIDDFIGCARYLIAHNYTTPAKLAGSGTSAGGVTIGNAIVQHPELFAAALDVVGDTNGVRDEFAEGGPANIPEFGTNTDPVGFKALYATDAYVHIRDGVAYPAVLAITGANDPRVAPWIVAKFAARLQAATSSGKPVLVRVDYDAGHGFLNSSRAQAQALTTDEYSFLFWQLGDPAFAPPVVPAPSATP